MLLSLTENNYKDDIVCLVGGKAASLMKLYSIAGLTSHVPEGFALTTHFFQSWVEQVMNSPDFKKTKDQEQTDKLKILAKSLPLSEEQSSALGKLQTAMSSWGLAAVRSSAPEEDGGLDSFAGAFETKLGVTSDTLEEAVRECFASVFDYRVFSYKGDRSQIAFAVVVMEMVNSYTAGVAFSANPLNSDLDELVIDSSWGLGESVVDGSIIPDHFVYDKVKHEVVEKTVGSKTQEKLLQPDGGVETRPVDEGRQAEITLSEEKLSELAHLVGLIETTYQRPMDVEWAYTADHQLKLLQARPITTLFRLDDNMITSPGEPRVLYYDFNIASEATTTTPFTHMDMTLYSKLSNSMFRLSEGLNVFPDDPKMLVFCSSTRQYMNLSYVFKFPFISPKYCSEQSKLLDPYLSDLFASKDCDLNKYCVERLPKEVSFYNAFWWMRQFKMWEVYKTSKKFGSKPQQSKEEYKEIFKVGMEKLRELESRGVNEEEGLNAYVEEMFKSMESSVDEEMGAIMGLILPLYNKLDAQRRDGKTEEERDEACALCGGYEGDELMELNIAMYRLARKLPTSVWEEYNHDTFDKLAVRIKANLDGELSDIPQEFLQEWTAFMDNFGYDGSDQLFVSSVRNVESPETLLAKIRHSVGEGIKDPSVTAVEKLAKRRGVMALQEERAKKQWYYPFALSSVRSQNAILDHVMWMRNAPKLHFSRVIAGIRCAVLQKQEKLVKEGRLDEVGDIFHLSIGEVDMALKDDSMDLKKILKPRKTNYERAKRATICPMLIDSRCRILRPDVKEQEPGTLVGAPISPGVATGRVRVVHHPRDPMEKDEVLVAIVTDPAWTPLFAGASAVILQIGGALQHGALCAREYGKPAVSGIDVITTLKTGMMVTVDGNTGVVKILDKEGKENGQPSKVV